MVKLYDVQRARRLIQLKALGRVTCLGWSSDGATIVSSAASRDGVTLWDATTGKRKHTLDAKALALTWNPVDQTELLAINDVGKTQIWHVGSQAVVAEFAAQADMSWHPRGQKLAYRDPQKRFCVWNAVRGARDVVSETDDAPRVSWSPNGKYVVTNANSGRATIWTVSHDTIGPEPLIAGDGVARTNFTWHPQGSRLAFADQGSISLWDASDGSMTQAFAQKVVTFASWSPDGEKLATGWSDRAVRIWNVDGKLIDRFAMQDDEVYCLNWSPDGGSIVVAGEESFQTWTLDSDVTTHRMAQCHRIHHVLWLHDGSILSQHFGKGVFRWTLDSPDSEHVSETAKSLAASRDRQHAAWTEDGQGIHVWNLQTGQRKVLLAEPQRTFSAVGVSSHGERIACLTRLAEGLDQPNWRVLVIDVATKAVVSTHDCGDWAKYVSYISWSPDDALMQIGTQLIAARDGATLANVPASSFLPWAWHPQEKLVAIPNGSAIQVKNASDQRLAWQAAPLTADLAATVNAAGQLLNPTAEVARHLVWIVEARNRNVDDLQEYPSLELRTRDDFLKRVVRLPGTQQSPGSKTP